MSLVMEGLYKWDKWKMWESHEKYLPNRLWGQTMKVSTSNILVAKAHKKAQWIFSGVRMLQLTYQLDTEVVAKKTSMWWLKPTTRPIYIYLKSWNTVKAIKREKMEVGKKNGSEEGNWGMMGRLNKKGIRLKQVDEQDNGKGGHEATWDFYVCKFWMPQRTTDPWSE
jgi:hypothetical protein